MKIKPSTLFTKPERVSQAHLENPENHNCSVLLPKGVTESKRGDAWDETTDVTQLQPVAWTPSSPPRSPGGDICPSKPLPSVLRGPPGGEQGRWGPGGAPRSPLAWVPTIYGSAGCRPALFLAGVSVSSQTICFLAGTHSECPMRGSKRWLPTDPLPNEWKYIISTGFSVRHWLCV